MTNSIIDYCIKLTGRAENNSEINDFRMAILSDLSTRSDSRSYCL